MRYSALLTLICSYKEEISYSFYVTLITIIEFFIKTDGVSYYLKYFNLCVNLSILADIESLSFLFYTRRLSSNLPLSEPVVEGVI